jgi:hypothetical protein
MADFRHYTCEHMSRGGQNARTNKLGPREVAHYTYIVLWEGNDEGAGE